VELGNDPCKPTITVRKSADTSSAKPRVTTTKTGQERSVRIGARTTEVLKSHRPRQPKERRMAAKSWADPGLVFPNTLGAIGRRHYLMESYRRLLKAPGLPSDIRFHHLRHTSATPPPHLRDPRTPPGHGPLHALSNKMLGHTDPAMTLRR
jgi:integrase